MLQLMIMLSLLVVVAMGIFGGYKKNILLVLMTLSFVGMLFCLLCYFIKIGGAFPQEALILYGLSWFLAWVSSISVELNMLGLSENIFRFATVYLFLLHGMQKSLYVRKWAHDHKYIYFVTAIPILLLLYFSNPYILYARFAYNYSFQNWIVNFSGWMIWFYLMLGFVLLFVEYTQIILTWHKKPHLANIIQLLLFCVPYLIFAGLDPIVIYQDYMRVCVFTQSILLTSGNSITVWVVTFAVCLIALLSLLVQSYIFLRFDYYSDKKEISITQKISSAEVTASMLLHGLKNQLLSANILSRKLAKSIEDDNVEKAQLIETSNKLLQINQEMSAKLSYLYKTVDNVNVILGHVSTETLLQAIKSKVQSKDVDEIVSYTTTPGGIFADVELLSEAITNIISNAIEAVKNTVGRKMVVVRIVFTRNHALITVADNGGGMDEEMKDKIFLPFTSSKNSTTNWGLGLCYTRRIIKQHHGDIRFNSQKGKGTIFYITLPRYFEKEKVKGGKHGTSGK